MSRDHSTTGRLTSATEEMDSTHSPDGTFHLFPDLPGELRRHIWKLCLPRRTFWVGHDATYHCSQYGPHVTSRDEAVYHRTLSRLPLISQVCQESRAVVFERGALYQPTDDRTTCWPVTPTWFDTSTDNFVSAESAHDGCDKQCLSRLRGATMQNFPVSVVFEWPYLMTRKSALFRRARELAPASRPVILADTVTLHLSHEDAVRCGLFGLWAEETTVLMDYNDTALLDKFIALFDRTTTGRGSTYNSIEFGDKRCRIQEMITAEYLSRSESERSLAGLETVADANPFLDVPEHKNVPEPGQATESDLELSKILKRLHLFDYSVLFHLCEQPFDHTSESGGGSNSDESDSERA